MIGRPRPLSARADGRAPLVAGAPLRPNSPVKPPYHGPVGIWTVLPPSRTPATHADASEFGSATCTLRRPATRVP